MALALLDGLQAALVPTARLDTHVITRGAATLEPVILIVLGLVANLLVRPVHPKHHLKLYADTTPGDSPLFWLLVVLPLAWGVTQSVKKSLPLFGGQATAVAPAK
ncbi:hypothetical protein HC891_15055 [Candidatus Gracilibacteria bacterium]|nr:hypothetical protein [Candidatus Gracilibacteria bacterium]